MRKSHHLPLGELPSDQRGALSYTYSYEELFEAWVGSRLAGCPAGSVSSYARLGKIMSQLIPNGGMEEHYLALFLLLF